MSTDGLGFEVDEHPKDVVLLLKGAMRDKDLMQQPMLFLPHERLSRLDARGPTFVNPRNKFGKQKADKFLATAAIVKAEPWKLTRAAEYLEKLVARNICEWQRPRPWHLDFIINHRWQTPQPGVVTLNKDALDLAPQGVKPVMLFVKGLRPRKRTAALLAVHEGDEKHDETEDEAGDEADDAAGTRRPQPRGRRPAVAATAKRPCPKIPPPALWPPRLLTPGCTKCWKVATRCSECRKVATSAFLPDGTYEWVDD